MEHLLWSKLKAEKNDWTYPKRPPKKPLDELSFFSASATKAKAFCSFSLISSQVRIPDQILNEWDNEWIKQKPRWAF